MIIQQKQILKRLTYTCLSLAIIILSEETQAKSRLPNDYINEPPDAIHRSISRTEIKSEETFKGHKYNLVGIALFSGKDTVSNAVKSLTGSKFSHVGLILSDVKDENMWSCFESTGTAEEVMHGIYPHVRPTTWESIKKDYPGKVNYRLFVFEDKDRINPNIVTKFVEENDGKYYTTNPLTLFRALFKLNRKSGLECTDTVFCSELTAQGLMGFGLLKEGVASNYLPKDFSSQSGITITSGVSLTPEFVEK